MNIQDVHFLFEYNYWANGKILSVCKNVMQEQFLASGEFPYGGLRGTFVHLVDGERIWRVLFETGKVTEDEDLVAEDFPNFETLEKNFKKKKK